MEELMTKTRIAILWVICLTLFLTLGTNFVLAESRTKFPQARRISANLAFHIYQNEASVIIDTMNRKTFKKHHIAGAINLPGSTKNIARIAEVKLPIPKDKLILVYCD
jgi:hypothetical protein